VCFSEAFVAARHRLPLAASAAYALVLDASAIDSAAWASLAGSDRRGSSVLRQGVPLAALAGGIGALAAPPGFAAGALPRSQPVAASVSAHSNAAASAFVILEFIAVSLMSGRALWDDYPGRQEFRRCGTQEDTSYEIAVLQARARLVPANAYIALRRNLIHRAGSPPHSSLGYFQGDKHVRRQEPTRRPGSHPDQRERTL